MSETPLDFVHRYIPPTAEAEGVSGITLLALHGTGGDESGGCRGSCLGRHHGWRSLGRAGPNQPRHCGSWPSVAAPDACPFGHAGHVRATLTKRARIV